MDAGIQRVNMIRPDFIVVGPDPRRTNVANPGGQLTATMGLLQYADDTGLQLAFVDTLQGSFPKPRFYVRMFKAARRQLQFVWYAAFNRPQKGVIIFSAGPGSFLERSVTGLVARLFRIPSVMCLRSGRLSPHLGAGTFAGRVISALLRMQPRVLVQGSNWLNDLDRVGICRSRVRVVANWIPPQKCIVKVPRKTVSGRPIRFVFVGWLVEEKGLMELFQACQSMYEKGLQFRLTVIGGGTLEESLRERIAVAGLVDVVSIKGWIEPGDVSGHMMAADVFVLPTYYEGFPNTLIEAFAAGLPAISTTVGAIPDSLSNGYNGYLIPPRDPVALENAMATYIRNSDLVEQHSKNALTVVEDKHNFRANCEKLFASVEV